MRTIEQVVAKSYATLSVELNRGEVLHVTLSRPNELNAVNEVMHEELTDLFGELAEIVDLGAAVLTGAGRAFCAGGDLDMVEAANRDPMMRLRQARTGAAFIRNLLSVRCPLIAAINGPAVGLGATIALLADISVMGRTAWLADPHVRVGLVAGDGGTLIWPLLVGPARAKEFLMRGTRIEADHAEALGLVNHVVDPGDVAAVAGEIALELSTGPREAIAGTKLAINARLLSQIDEGIGLSLALETHSWASADVVEGVVSLREKREPRWPSSAGARSDKPTA